MADYVLRNRAVMDGSYDDIVFEDFESTEVLVTIPEIPFSKTADKRVWMDGYLVYTLTVDNSAADGAISNIVISDQIDISVFQLDEASIAITIGARTLVLNTDYTVSYNAAGLLTITIDTSISIAAGETAVITFRGTKA